MLKKLLFVLWIANLFINSIIFPDIVFGQTANCQIEQSPDKLIQNVAPLRDDIPEDQRWFKFWIKVKDTTATYKVVFREGSIWDLGRLQVERTGLRPNADGVLLGPDGNPPGIKYDPISSLVQPGSHGFYVVKEGVSGRYCDGSYKIEFDLSGGIKNCSIEFDPNDPDETQNITVKGTLDPPGTYGLKIPGRTLPYFRVDASGNIPPQNIGKFNPGQYSLTFQIEQTGGPTGSYMFDTNCQALIDVASQGSKGSAKQIGTPGPGGTRYGAPIRKTCDPNDVSYEPKKCTLSGGKEITGCTGDRDNPGIATAIGCIHTNPNVLVRDILTFAVAIGGGLAFLMMLLGAYQMLTSRGNPETLNAGRERLTGAIVGLLFIIFSILLLQLIGFDILRIPGFGR